MNNSLLQQTALFSLRAISKNVTHKLRRMKVASVTNIEPPNRCLPVKSYIARSTEVSVQISDVSPLCYLLLLSVPIRDTDNNSVVCKPRCRYWDSFPDKLHLGLAMLMVNNCTRKVMGASLIMFLLRGLDITGSSDTSLLWGNPAAGTS